MGKNEEEQDLNAVHAQGGNAQNENHQEKQIFIYEFVMEIGGKEFADMIHDVSVGNEMEGEKENLVALRIQQCHRQADKREQHEHVEGPEGDVALLFSEKRAPNIAYYVNGEEQETGDEPPVQIDPQEHDRWQQVEVIFLFVLVGIEDDVPDERNEQGKGVRTREPVDRRCAHRKDRNESGNDDTRAGSLYEAE